jgi:hypothetical protein
MNGQNIYEMLSKMEEHERKNMELLILTEPYINYDLAHNESLYLAGEIEKLDVIQSAEIANNISSEEFAECQKKALDDFIDEHNEELDELANHYFYHLRYQFKEKMIEKLREIGYEVPEGI